jgi:hypothetical protein
VTRSCVVGLIKYFGDRSLDQGLSLARIQILHPIIEFEADMRGATNYMCLFSYVSNVSISAMTSLTRVSFVDAFNVFNASFTPKTCFAAVLILVLLIVNAVPSAIRPRKTASESAVSLIVFY